ncbi:MAG TPA: hypothetical protein VJJ20_02340 [Candidatus Paceibacterota bacterium]
MKRALVGISVVAVLGVLLGGAALFTISSGSKIKVVTPASASVLNEFRGDTADAIRAFQSLGRTVSLKAKKGDRLDCACDHGKPPVLPLEQVVRARALR